MSQESSWSSLEVVAGTGALHFQPRGSRAMCFEKSSQFEKQIWRESGARIDFEILGTITPLFMTKEAGNVEIPLKFRRMDFR